MKTPAILGCLLACGVAASAQSVTDPHITTWLTSRSAQYARVYETSSDKTAGTADNTWPRSGLTNSGGGQATPAYADIQRVAYSNNYVYVYTTGLASYTMGNWLNPQGNVFMFWPTNRAAIHRIPRTPTIPTTKSKAHGVGGVWINGVYLWENGDAQSYSTSTGQVSFNGQGIWNRLAGVAEAFNFDSAYGHQPSSGAYHTHINPIGLRYQVGDNVTYDSSTKTYHEATIPTKHSPILGWALDGLPVYGPYGYSDPMDPNSGIRRMRTGFQKRDGTNGSTNLTSTGRTTLPVWAASVQGVSQTLPASDYGPNVNTTYPLGTFAEDYDYMGDLGKTQGVDFDLNRQNVRYCVTPEYPNGTYAYFVSIDSTGATAFPDVINQEFYGTADSTPGNQGTVTSITEAVTEYQDAGPASAITVTATVSGSGVSLSWNSAEGATYKVESSADNVTWTSQSNAVTSGGLTTTYAATTANYYRVTLTAIASYDTGGTYGTPVGKSGSVQYGTPAATAPSITTQPANVTIATGAAASFAVAASGTAPLAYQWKKDGNAISGATSATYSIAATQATDAGSYTCTVSNSAGSATSTAATLTVTTAAAAPTITTQPQNATVTVGGAASFSVVATGTAPLTYQWYKDAVKLNAGTSATYSIASAQAIDAGGYTCVISNSAGNVTSSPATLTVSSSTTGGGSSGGGGGTPEPAHLVNLSARTQVGGSAGSPVIGFTLSGSGSGKQLVVRAVGPTLKNYGVDDALADPQLQLWTNGTQIGANDNWNAADADTFNAVGAFPLQPGSADAAVVTTLAPGTYSTPVIPASGNGVVLVECYDAAPTDTTTTLINASARAMVGTGTRVLIPAFVVEGEGTLKLLIRAVGPQLQAYGVRDALLDPQLTVYRDSTVVAQNDNWSDAANAADIAAAADKALAFALPAGSKDAAVLVSLPAGTYTVVASGVGDTTGTALVEFYVAQ